MKTVIDRIEERLVWMEIRNKPVTSLPALALLTVQEFYAFVSLCDVTKGHNTTPRRLFCSERQNSIVTTCAV